MTMVDLHSHILPGIDDGAADVNVSLAMANAFLADGVSTVACTPHILPGLYHNTGPQIRKAVADLQAALDQAGLPLRLVTGADNHIAGDFVASLAGGRLLTLADSRYVLVEPPHHVAPARMEEFFFSILVAGYVPILTHPERLTWIKSQYATIQKLLTAGVWMQITCGSLTGAFGRDPKYWGERMLDEGAVHILASDAHDISRRPPCMSRARELVAKRVGAVEARNLVETRPTGVIANEAPSALPPLPDPILSRASAGQRHGDQANSDPGALGLAGRLRRFFK
jgi:protein-tyrosine phosphatase